MATKKTRIKGSPFNETDWAPAIDEWMKKEEEDRTTREELTRIPPNYETYASRRPLRWTIYEAACLILGLDPERMSRLNFVTLLGSTPEPEASHNRLVSDMELAEARKELRTFTNPKSSDGGFERRLVEPFEVVAVAEYMGHSPPALLREALEKFGRPYVIVESASGAMDRSSEKKETNTREAARAKRHEKKMEALRKTVHKAIEERYEECQGDNGSISPRMVYEVISSRDSSLWLVEYTKPSDPDRWLRDIRQILREPESQRLIKNTQSQ